MIGDDELRQKINFKKTILLCSYINRNCKERKMTWSSYGGPGLSGALSLSNWSNIFFWLLPSSSCFTLLGGFGGFGGFGGLDLLWTTRMSLKLVKLHWFLPKNMFLTLLAGLPVLLNCLCLCTCLCILLWQTKGVKEKGSWSCRVFNALSLYLSLPN